jgi:pilus assembly protein CpaC
MLLGGWSAGASAAAEQDPPLLRPNGAGAGQQPAALLQQQARPAPAPGPAKNLTIPIGVTQRLQMKDRKRIKTAVNAKENVAILAPVPDDPTSIQITGREAGTTRITLTAEDGTEEIYDVLVQIDIEYLRMLLQRAVPTATLQLLPGAGGVIVISGTVNHAEDIETIMRTAQAIAPGERTVNAMRVAGVQQVELDVVVAFVSRSELRRMSFDFLEAGLHHNFSSTVGGALVNPTQGAMLSSIPHVATAIENTATNAPNGAPANFFLGLFNDKQIFYGLLQVLRNDNLAKILAEPKLVTLSGRSATLLSGGQQAIPETAGLGSVSVRFEPFGTQLSFLPIVLGNGKIQLEVEPEVSNIDASVGTSIAGTVVPGRNTQRVHTTVVIEDGQTLAIGGLIQNTVTGVTVKVPVLGDLPYLGTAFSSKSFQETESEMVVLVTPHLVDPMACNQVPKYVPGTETRSPDDYELFLEGILEAPRGPREVCPGGRYTPAFKNGPTADVFPCAGGNGGCDNGRCATNGASCTGCTSNSAPADKSVTTSPAATKPADQAATPGALPPLESNAPAVEGESKPSTTEPAEAPAKATSKPFALPWTSGSPRLWGTK